MLQRLFKDRDNGFYIDVGAMDPVEGSVTKHFYDRGWQGINVEAEDRWIEKLRTQRPRDINLNLALGREKEIRPFYHFEEQGLSTFDPEFAETFRAQNKPVHISPVQVNTLSDVCRQYASSKEIDFLKVDAEGWEGEILMGGDWVSYRPTVLVIEATLPYSSTPAWQKWEPFLFDNGYVFAYFDGLNRYYLEQKRTDLLNAFSTPPNVVDDFQVYAVTQLLAERDQLLAQRQQELHERERLLQDRDHLHARIDQLWHYYDQARRSVELELLPERDRLKQQLAQANELHQACERHAAEVGSQLEELTKAHTALLAEADQASRRAEMEVIEQDRQEKLWVGERIQKAVAEALHPHLRVPS